MRHAARLTQTGLGIALAASLLATGAATGGAASPAPTVAIVWPAPAAATSARTIAVDVRFAASANDGAGGPTGNVHTVVLELDGREVGRYANPPRIKAGSHQFTVDLGAFEGAHVLRAFAYQGSARAGLRGESAPVRLVVDRTPPELGLTAPLEGEFVRESRVVVRGTVSDAGSGLASLSCAGSNVAVAATFSCEASLVDGVNELTVRAVDRAGNETARTVTVHHQPGGLAGSSATPALAAIEDVFAPEALVDASEITAGVVRTQLELVLAPDAALADVNALLRRIHGRIVSSRAGVAIALVRIPDPGSLDALDAILGTLALDPVLRAAAPALMLPPDALPDIVALADVRFVGSQLAVRAHAAWNARAALAGSTPPTLVIADYFGGGPPGDMFGVAATSADFSSGAANEHGWMVLGIAAAAFGPVGGALAADAVTGIYPGSIPLRVADVTLGLAGPALRDRMLELVESAPGKVVVNTSLGGWGCSTPVEAARFCSTAHATAAALRWIERVRGTDPARPSVSLEGKFVHATSAGNLEPSPVGPLGAAVNSDWTAATLLSPLVDPVSGLTVPNLANTLVVENFTSTATEPFRPGCIASSAEIGGTIAGVGSPVHSFDSPTTARDHGDGGSSAATPQVAGVAAYVWALAPGLSPAQLVGVLGTTARPSSAGCGGASVIDAYAALLAADAFDPALPVRAALLDADENGAFDELDLAAFVAAFATANGAVDYGRHDLNGDGRTGGDARDRFDFDVDTTADRWSDSQEQTINTVPAHFDDSAATDLDVLCYYAHSTLYSGDTAVRDAFAVDHCLEVSLETAFPAAVDAGADYELVVRVRRSSGQLQPGVHLDLTATGGVVGDGAGVTDSAGTFRTSGRALAGATELRIEIVARAGAGGAELARTTVTAGITQAVVDVTPIGGPLPHFARVLALVGVDGFASQVLSGGAPFWTRSVSVSRPEGTASARLTLAEAILDGKLQSVTLNGAAAVSSGPESPVNSAASQYFVSFRVGAAGVRYAIDASVSVMGGPSAFVLLGLQDVTRGEFVVGSFVESSQPTVNATGHLEPGDYAFMLNGSINPGRGGSPDAAALSFSGTLRFSPPGSP